MLLVVRGVVVIVVIIGIIGGVNRSSRARDLAAAVRGVLCRGRRSSEVPKWPLPPARRRQLDYGPHSAVSR